MAESTLPFAPLTRDECRERYREAQHLAGITVMNNVSDNGAFQPRDYTLEHLTSLGRTMGAYRTAWHLRARRITTSGSDSLTS